LEPDVRQANFDVYETEFDTPTLRGFGFHSTVHHKQAICHHLHATTGKDIPFEFIQKQGVQHKNPYNKATIISKEPIWEILIESQKCEIMEQGNGDLASSLNSTSPIVYYAMAHKDMELYETLLHEHIRQLDSSRHIAVVDLDSRILSSTAITVPAIPLRNLALMEMAPGTEEEPLFLNIWEMAYPGEVHSFMTVSHFAPAKVYLDWQFMQLICDSVLPEDIRNKPFAFGMLTITKKRGVSIPTIIGKFPALPHKMPGMTHLHPVEQGNHETTDDNSNDQSQLSEQIFKLLGITPEPDQRQFPPEPKRHHDLRLQQLAQNYGRCGHYYPQRHHPQ
jgi:hypothetical protein